jgi:signal transduction histidine kinase
MKHAEASHVDISLHYTTTHLGVTIKDNGKGFVKNSKQEGSGLD